MQIKIQKRLAARILKCSENDIWLDPNRLEEIKEAITKVDLRSLIKDSAIMAKRITGISNFRAKKKRLQKSKGRQRGAGSIKGGKNARLRGKTAWMGRIRVQRGFLKNLRDKKAIDLKSYRSLYMKSKGGFFRSKRHLKMFMQEHGIGK